jgi:hypothetical protein
MIPSGAEVRHHEILPVEGEERRVIRDPMSGRAALLLKTPDPVIPSRDPATPDAQ